MEKPMSERRSLVEGLKARPESDRSLEEAFVFGTKAAKPAPPAKARPATPERAVAPKQAASPASAEEGTPNPATVTRPAANIARVPFTTRLRSDMAQALKRASLERQLEGVEPNTVQEILESALEPWLKANGYLT